jgi:hypothetical protein
MIRILALALAFFVALGAILPIATDYTSAKTKHSYVKKKKKKKLKKYSRAWWRSYHRNIKKKKAIAARKRALRVKQILLARAKKAAMASEKAAVVTEKTQPEVVAKVVPTATPKAVVVKEPKASGKKIDRTPKADQRVAAGLASENALLPTGEAAPTGWKRGGTNQSETQYRVDDESGVTVGSASLSVVERAVGTDNNSGRNKTLGGIPTNALRRTVIDKMVREEGWVVNDYQKDVNGRKVYVVVAQSPGAGGRIQSRIFYFTEVDGKIYSLATNSPVDSAERIAKDSERLINSLHKNARPVQQAELR